MVYYGPLNVLQHLYSRQFPPMKALYNIEQTQALAK